MSRRLYTLVLAQFLSAFGDNAILFTVIAMALGGVSQVWMAKGVLLIIGIRGGMFVAPVNAAIQDIGRRGVGSGSAVAVQNFFQNSAILTMYGTLFHRRCPGCGHVINHFLPGWHGVVDDPDDRAKPAQDSCSPSMKTVLKPIALLTGIRYRNRTQPCDFQ